MKRAIRTWYAARQFADPLEAVIYVATILGGLAVGGIALWELMA